MLLPAGYAVACPVLVGPLLGCVVALAAVTAVAAQAPGPLAVARQWFAAEQRPDAGAQLALMTDDAVLTGAAGLCALPCVGQAAIRPELERRRTDGTTPQLTIISQEATGDTVTNRVEIRGQPVRNAGFERYITVLRIEVPAPVAPEPAGHHPDESVARP